MVTLRINGKKIQARQGKTILEAARDNAIYIPTLCHQDVLAPYGACRLCIVEIGQGRQATVQPACSYPVAQGLVVRTHTQRVRKARQVIISFMMQTQDGGSDAVRRLAEDCNVAVPATKHMAENNNCILCGLCVRACGEIVGRGAIGFSGRGHARTVAPPFHEASPDCIGCGTCVAVCPTQYARMEDLLEDEPVRTLAQWKTRMSLRVCKECRNPFFPAPSLDRFRDENVFATPEFLDVCPSCRVPPQVDEQRCTACNACIVVCPVGAARFVKRGEGQKSHIFAENCCGCHTCVDVCGWGAIKRA